MFVKYKFISIIKFVADTTVIGFISNENESACLKEVEDLIVWCHGNHLSLNIKKTKKIIVQSRRTIDFHYPLFIAGSPIMTVS